LFADPVATGPEEKASARHTQATVGAKSPSVGKLSIWLAIYPHATIAM